MALQVCNRANKSNYRSYEGHGEMMTLPETVSPSLTGNGQLA